MIDLFGRRARAELEKARTQLERQRETIIELRQPSILQRIDEQFERAAQRSLYVVMILIPPTMWADYQRERQARERRFQPGTYHGVPVVMKKVECGSGRYVLYGDVSVVVEENQ